MFQRFNRLFFLLIFLTNVGILKGQSLSGQLLSEENNSPIIGVKVFLENNNKEVITNAGGNFRFVDLEKGNYKVKAFINGKVVEVGMADINNADTNLGTITVKTSVDVSKSNDLSIIDFSDLAGNESENDNYSGLLNASQDIIGNAAAFNLSFARFRMRGYTNEDSDLMINGMPMNDLDDGRILWNAWAGLNDVFRVQTDIMNLQANEFGFGGIGGIRMIDLRASDQRKQKKAVYTASNRTYQHRVMYTQSTGMQKNGWAFSFSGSIRYGETGYIKGTNMLGASYFVSVDKKIGNKHLLNALFFGAPLRRGRSSGAVQEMYDILNDNFYNPNWGYQNGEVRNSREYITNQPVAMIRHDFSINRKFKLSTTVGYQFGTFGSTRLDWYDAPDPRPDYYRKLPSYYKSDPFYKDLLTNQFVNDVNTRQINWDQLYDANSTRFYSFQNANGIPGNTVSGKFAAYILEQEHFDSEKKTLNSIFTFVPNRKFTLNGGIQYINDITHNYREIEDLLGAEFYIDLDRFSTQDFPDNPEALQNDLNRPNRIVKEGDRLGHDYDINLTKASAWLQGQIQTKRVDYFVAVQLSHTSFFREGFTKNGRFPDNSFGKSEVHSFLNYGVKGGATLKIDGNNYLSVRATQKTRAPFSRQAYLSPRIKDAVVEGLENEEIFSADISYELRYSRLKGRVSAYYSTFKNQISNDVFYHDDLTTFVNYAMTGIDKLHAGVEMGVEYQISPMFTFMVMGNVGEYFYTSRPLVTINRDNSSEVLVKNREVFLENYFVGGLPQKAAVVGLDIFLKDYWRVDLNVNAFADTYLDPNPDRRTSEGVDLVDPVNNAELYRTIVGQEKLPGGVTLDVGIFKSWRLKNRDFIRFNANISNVLNNKDIRTGGFEQLRYDFVEKDVDLFPSRYFYAFGTNYVVSLSYIF
ncbi:MAG: TonB-dependent receptor [Saprospiraceae bacterium]|nr:TonB-dependent receptor [Saprospiraceae bacterium]MBK8369924.1 TonB-dependent receptor [Saprospiraceae bacterium]MBK8855836.1 TonB-dependent receptor [Saprospiraceae bacterium]